MPSKQELLKLLNKLTGFEKTNDDSITPTISPLDFIPYEGIIPVAKTVAPAIEQGVASLSKSAARQLMSKAEESPSKLFNPNQMEHIEAIRPHLMKSIPDDFSQGYSNGGEVIADMLRDPEKQANLLKMPQIKKAIETAGFESSAPVSEMFSELKKKVSVK